jgi:hypothetical protein|tara:strand:+ start:122 stop:337 length:216 start_codon:yes stop_codon:yes gene_type:complete
MKLKYILGEREINKNEIFSTGECETVNNGDCSKCDWKLYYDNSDVPHLDIKVYECMTDCGCFTTMNVRTVC